MVSCCKLLFLTALITTTCQSVDSTNQTTTCEYRNTQYCHTLCFVTRNCETCVCRLTVDGFIHTERLYQFLFCLTRIAVYPIFVTIFCSDVMKKIGSSKLMRWYNITAVRLNWAMQCLFIYYRTEVNLYSPQYSLAHFSSVKYMLQPTDDGNKLTLKH